MSLVSWLLVALMMPAGCRRDATDGPAPAQQLDGERLQADSSSAEPLMVYGKVPEFRLTNQQGEVFDSTTLTGQVYLVTFFFTTCPTTCPQQSRELSRLQDVNGLSVLSITVQPQVDTPETLRRYAQQYRADLSKWHFLTGTRDEIWTLSQKGFMLPVGDSPQPGEMPIFHSSKIILVDGKQQIRGFYESQIRSEMIALRDDAKQLIAQSNDAVQADELVDEELSELTGDLQGAFQEVGAATESDHTAKP